MTYTVTCLGHATHRIFRCRMCQRPGWKWFPKGSNAKRRKIAAPPADFLVGNKVALPDGTVKLCDSHARALCGDDTIDAAITEALGMGPDFTKEAL